MLNEMPFGKMIFDQMAFEKNIFLMKCQKYLDVMTTWWNYELLKWQFDEIMSYWNDNLMKLWATEMAIWWNCELPKITIWWSD